MSSNNHPRRPSGLPERIRLPSQVAIRRGFMRAQAARSAVAELVKLPEILFAQPKNTLSGDEELISFSRVIYLGAALPANAGRAKRCERARSPVIQMRRASSSDRLGRRNEAE